jgi:mycofactocin precursor
MTAIADDEQPDDEALVADLLVEEVSIDGMCGVY